MYDTLFFYDKMDLTLFFFFFFDNLDCNVYTKGLNGTFDRKMTTILY